MPALRVQIPQVFSRILAAIGAAKKSDAGGGRILEHAPVRTSEQAAEVRGVTLEEGAKASLFKSEKPGKGAHGDWFLLVHSAAARRDNKKFKEAFGKAYKAASEDECFEHSGCLPGAVPPFGSLFKTKTPTFVDVSLASREIKKISFNAGLRTTSVVGLDFEVYRAIEKPDIVDVTE